MGHVKDVGDMLKARGQGIDGVICRLLPQMTGEMMRSGCCRTGCGEQRVRSAGASPTAIRQRGRGAHMNVKDSLRPTIRPESQPQGRNVIGGYSWQQ